MKSLKHSLIIALAVLFSTTVNAQSVAIGEREFTAHPSAILEIQSTDKGILIPRVTFNQRLHIPTNAQAIGLLVFQVDGEVGFYYFDGRIWRFLEPNVNSEMPNLAPVAFSGSWNDVNHRPDIQEMPSLAQVAFTGNYNDLKNFPFIPAHIRDLQQDSLHMSVTRQQVERWDNAVKANSFTGSFNDLQNRPNFHKVSTSGSFYDLENRPNIHNVALSGSWNNLIDRPDLSVLPILADVAFTGSFYDLKNRPSVPTHLRDLQQDNITHLTVSRQQIDRWDNKSNFSGSWNDLTGRPFIPSHLRDFEQDLLFMTVTRQQIERWNNKSNFSGNWNDLNDRPTVPTHASQLQQDDNFYMTVNRQQVERWDGAAFASAFSGHFDDLVGKPNFHAIATTGHWDDLENVEAFPQVLFTGSWNDLADRPAIPTRTSQLQQAEQKQLASDEDIERWNNKSDFSGSWIDLTDRPNFHSIAVSATANYELLHQRPNFHAVATSGRFSDIVNVPVIPESALTGHFNDLAGVPAWGNWFDIMPLRIGTSASSGFLNQFSRIGHRHTIDNFAPEQPIGTGNNTILSTRTLHNTLMSGIGGDLVSAGVGFEHYRFNIRNNVVLRGFPTVEISPADMSNQATVNYVATTAYITEEINLLRTEITNAITQIRNNVDEATSSIPIGTIVMTTQSPSAFGGNCWIEVTDMRGRFPIGAGNPTGQEFLDPNGNHRSVAAGATLDNAMQHGRYAVTLSLQEMPRHNHDGEFLVTGTWGSDNNHALTGTAPNQGDGQAHENRPPFFGVHFMMRVYC